MQNIERHIRNSGVDGRVKGVKAKQTPQMVRNWEEWLRAVQRARLEESRERGGCSNWVQESKQSRASFPRELREKRKSLQVDSGKIRMNCMYVQPYAYSWPRMYVGVCSYLWNRKRRRRIIQLL